jgi:hypothetical protein
MNENDDFLLRHSNLVPLRRYMCERGHKIEVRGIWTAFVVAQDNKTYDFNYCLVCFGEWAQGKWPLKCEVIEDASEPASKA